MDTTRINELFKAMIERKASDLHLAVQSPPTFRVNSVLIPDGGAPLTFDDVKTMVYSLLSEAQRIQFEQEKELDFSYGLAGVSRFRGNLLMQRGTIGAVFRAIPYQPPKLNDLGFAPILKELCAKSRGLVLVTGPTGSGKSTTLAAMIDYINEREAVHIVTIEDPVEFLYKNKKAMIRQRELGQDTSSFAQALKHVLRQDPNVILVGEMRDLETIALALTAAETGHLVLSTLHTTSSSATVDRIVDVFPAHQQEQIRVQLASVFEGAICQTLVRTADGSGRVCAVEVMIGTPAVRNLIREGSTHQLMSVIQSGGKWGMTTLDFSLKELVTSGQATFEDCLLKSNDPEGFRRLCGQS